MATTTEWEDEWAEDASDDGGASRDWSLASIERDLAQLPAARSAAGAAIVDAPSSEDVEQLKLAELLQLADAAARAVDASRERLAALDALALVTKSQLLAARAAFSAARDGGEDADASEVLARLRASAGRWAEAAPTERESHAAHRKLQETSVALRHALAAGSGSDLAPFQQVLEQVFASLPQHTLAVSVAWIRETGESDPVRVAVESSASSETSKYLAHLQEILDPERVPERAVAVLSEAEVFQDAKDIKRDELVINGTFVPGTLGYAAIVDRLQRQIHETLDAHIGRQSAGGYEADEYAAATRAIAKQILNACNRTESGGSSYEILSKFLSNHETDAVLIRPDSAKAAPLEICLDVGAFVEKSSRNGDEMWAFGVRALLSAVTWYLICEADDPTSELYEVKTTYENRLAFPLGLTPFHPLNSMRRDSGVVSIQLLLPHAAVSPPVSPVHADTSMFTTKQPVAPVQHGATRDADSGDLL